MGRRGDAEKDYSRTVAPSPSSAPFPHIRIIVQQLVVILGGFLLLVFQSPLPFLLLLMLLKTLADLGSQTFLLEQMKTTGAAPAV